MKADILKKQIQGIIEQAACGRADPQVMKIAMADIKRSMTDNPETRKELGPLLGQLKNALAQQTDNHESITWVAVCGGKISIGHRPKVKALKTMKAVGVTHVLTLLTEKEGAKTIEKAVHNAQLEWLWYPMASAQPPAHNQLAAIREFFSQTQKALTQGANIYIHCSAGIHRTGMISYALLRHLGFNATQATALLHEMRDVTGDGVGSERKEWGDQFEFE